MIRVAANLCKKVPIQGLEFSSQQFGASIETEVSDAENADVLQARIRQLYSLLNQAVDEQIHAAGLSPKALVAPSPQTTQPQPAALPQNNPPNRLPAPQTKEPGKYPPRNGRAHNGRVNATQAQVRALYAITKDLGLDLQSVLADFNASRPEELHIRDASALIGRLKAQQTGQTNPQN